MNQISSCFFWVKLRAANIRKLKPGIQKALMEGAIIGYVRISGDALAQPHGDNLDPIWSPNCFLLNFTRIL